MSERRDRAIVAAYKGGARAAQLLPRRALPVVEWLGGLLFMVFMRGRRSTVARHLQRVRPELRGAELKRMVRASFRSYAKYYIESFRLPALPIEEVRAGLTHEGYEHLQAAIDSGTGFIMAMPHLGGWEWGGRWAADEGKRLAAVVEPLEPKELFEWFAALRTELGMQVIALGPEAAGATVKALKDNSVLCLLCDRDLQGTGVEVEFFGEKTTLPAGPATLALRQGAPLAAVTVYYRAGGNHHGVIRPIEVERRGSFRSDVQRITQDIAREFENYIREAPDQWHLFQPNWPSDPGYRRERG
ncbi:MAG: phosphatidylinositol mannoside acyltransferase [Acidimicrobiia bacterium]